MLIAEKGQPFYLCLKILLITGHMPAKNDSGKMFLLRFLRCNLFCLIVFVNAIGHMLRAIKHNTGESLAFDQFVVFVYGPFLLAACFFTLHRKKFLRICNDIINSEKFGLLSLEKLQTKSDFYLKVVLVYNTVAVAMAAIIYYVSTAHCKSFNEWNSSTTGCMTISPILLDNISMPLAWFISFCQIVAISTTFYAVTAVAWMICFNAHVVARHIEKLNASFHKILDCENQVERRKKLQLWTKYHDFILRVAKDLGNVHKLIMGHSAITESICLATLGKTLLTENPFLVAACSFGVGFGGILVCHWGQNMLDAVQSIQETICTSKWYECDVGMIKDIQFILLRSKEQIGLAVLPKGWIGYPLILMVVKSSVSYIMTFHRSS